jgi:hypothetical protein
MRTKWWVLQASLCACAVVVAGGCRKAVQRTQADEALSKRIAAATSGRNASELNFAWLAPRDWDQMYIFAPYTNRQDIDQRLGFAWSDTSATRVDESETISLLVFVKDKKVTHWVDFPREKADFSLVSSPTAYTPRDARFSVRNDKVWPMVEPLAEAQKAAY